MPKVRKGRTRMTPEQQRAHAQEQIDRFDAEFPVGAPVWYWTALPFGPVRETRIRGGAWEMNAAGQIVCLVEGVAGGVSIHHIQPVDESRRADIRFIETATARDDGRLKKAAEHLRTAAGLVDSAAGLVPVIGDAELHCLRLDLRKLGESLLRLADIATARSNEAGE